MAETSAKETMSLHIGDDTPEFRAETTEGTIDFHNWIGDGWAILFSRPKDFTPVCTTELGYMAGLEREFARRNCKIIGLSVDSVSDHKRWAKDIQQTQGHEQAKQIFRHGWTAPKPYRELARRPDLFDVRRIVVRHPARHIAAGVSAELLTTNAIRAAEEAADVVVELMGGEEPATRAIERALTTGHAVVTANKGVMAKHVGRLEAVAQASGSSIRYSAAVGGAVPVLEAVRRIAADPERAPTVVSVRGIVNGTCNFILEQLEHGASLEDAVALAQAKGFAEADPSSDLSGADAAATLAILARLILNGEIPQVDFCGIDEEAAGRARQARGVGRRLRLLAALSNATAAPRLRVSLTELTSAEWLTGLVGEENALEIEFADGGRERIWGRGAGRHPTTVSVMADIYDAWRSR